MIYNEDNVLTDIEKIEARQSIFSAAGRLAIAEAIKRGIPITYTENDKIIKRHPDGTEEILGNVKPNVRISTRSIRLK
jgi:hypothetical protein